MLDVTGAVRTEELRARLRDLHERSDFYRDKLQASGLRPADLDRVADLSELPFTVKEELRDSQVGSPPLGRHAAVPMSEVVRVHASTGTTGRASWVGLTRSDVESWTALTARALATEGLEESDVVVHAASLALFVGGLPVKDAIERIGATLVPIGTGASERAVMAFQTLGCNVLHSTPSYAIYLADYVRQRYEIEPRQLGVAKVMVGGEPGGGEPAVRARIARDWGARVTEGLGSADVAPIMFAECPEGSGMHFTAAGDVAIELVEPATGRGLAFEEGAEGELVYTSLTRECCPLLRFRSRDHVVVLGTGCKCGRQGPRIRCTGRTDDMLIVLGVNVFPSAIQDVVSELHPRTTGAVQVLLSRPGPKVEPPLRVVVEYGRDATDLAALRGDVQSLIRGRLQVSAEIELVPPATLPRSEMKTQLIRRLYEGGAQ
jgi:phenylacetate-CoA ligase